ncbi:MAG: hypothetical protein P8R43_05975, partial [Planctomycetota bacterium]|nr:hypothetical protein [Planctomycetota bacterium]
MAQEETGAAAGSGRRAGWQADASGAGWDPEQWWSFGQAADRADVTHRTLQTWAEQGKLMVRTAWREGMEVRLVRAGDVARLAPGVAFSEGVAASLEERALFTGPRRSGLGAGAPAPPRSQGDFGPRPYEDDRDALRRTAELEIDRLRAELEALRGRGDARAAASPASPAAMDLWSAEEHGGLGAG